MQPVIKPLVRTPRGPWAHLSREAITNRFLFCVSVAKADRRKGCKTDAAIAREIGMTQQNMSKYYNGTQDVTLEQVARFCEVFGFNDSYLLRGVGNLEEMMTTNLRIDKLEAQFIELQKQVDLVLSQRKK